MGDDGRRLGWRYSSAGIEFAVVFTAFVLLGLWIDRATGVLADVGFPVNTTLGAAIGFGLALWRLLKQVRRPRDRDRKNDE